MQLLVKSDFDELYPRLMATAMSKVKNRDIAQDLVGATLLAAVEHAKHGMTLDDLVPWCIVVLRNKYRDLQKKKFDRISDDAKSKSDPEYHKYIPRESQFFENEEANKRSDVALSEDPFSNLLFNDCMKQLNPDHAEVMMMNTIKSLTTKTIAEILGKPQGTVLSWLTKAKMQFHKCIKGIS